MAYTPAGSFTTRPTLQGTFGMTASTHWLATASAQAVLERGGNAFDAAVAGAFVLHVVEPHLNGPGGDMTGVFTTAGNPSEPVVLMGQGPAPAAATRGHYLAERLELVPGAGALAAAVPAAVDAWLLLLRDHGTWDLADVLSFAIGYARNGHPVLDRVAGTIASVAGLFREHWPTSAALWMPDGNVPAGGDIVKNVAYADVLEQLIAAGQDAEADGGTPAPRPARIDAARREWREGLVAKAAVEFLAEPHRHSSGTDHAGVITEADFAAFSAGYEPAATLEFRGHTIAKTGPWGAGAGAAADARDPGRVRRRAPGSLHRARRAHHPGGAEAGHRGPRGVLRRRRGAPGLPAGQGVCRGAPAADRGEGLASVPARRGSRPHTLLPPLRTEYLPPSLAARGDGAFAGVGEPTVQPTGETRGDTCHIDVVDQWGNMVSATPSGGWLQSSPAVPGLGFCLGTRLQMTWLEDGAPSTLTPGKRPRTTLTPTLVLRSGQAVAALGSPGGDQQDQWQLLYLLRTIVGGYEPQQAIDAPAFHTTSIPGSFWPRTWTPGGAVVEDRLGDGVIAGLEARGHVVPGRGTGPSAACRPWCAV